MICAACGHASESESRFCPNCGAAAVAGPASAQLQGERRYLIVMFCDLVGSTPLSERLDPEDFGETVLAYQETGREIVETHGGFVAHYAGDGLLAFFGYPVAHEDDADRAVKAALAILDAMPGLNADARRFGDVTLAARVGIHSGPTVIGSMGAANRTDISLFGLTPNVAARLEGIAAPGTIVISETAARVLRGRFQLTDLGTPDLKGVTQRLAVHRVDGVAESQPFTVSPEGQAMVGRHAERDALVAAFDRAGAAGCQSMLVSGEPGVGKTTLVQSLALALAGRPHLWLEFRCSELAQASPLRPVVTGLRDLLDISDQDAPDDQLAKLAAGLDAQGAATAELLPFLADLLGIFAPELDEGEGLSSEIRRARTLDALIEWTTATAAQAPLVIVTEDLQWADPTTRELLHRVRARSVDCPILLVCTSRVSLVDAGLFDEADRVALGRLSVAESRALAASLSATYAVPEDQLLVLAERGDGIPLFIEELVRGAAESTSPAESGTAGLPDTLQSLLAARLDRLGGARAVAQAASVIGRGFSVELLAVVSGVEADLLYRQLHELLDAGIVVRQSGPGGEGYRFRHALIQDAAYASLLRRDRRQLHGVIAAALPTLEPSAVVGAPELVAQHYEAAGAPMKAAQWFADAGRRACERAALLEAISHFESGIALLRGTQLTFEAEGLLLSLLILCANAHMGTAGPGGEVTLPLWEDAIALAEELGNLDELTSALNGVATYRTDRGELEATIAIATKILAISTDSGSRVAALRGHLSLGMAYFYQGEGVRALSHCEQGLALERDGDYLTVTYGVGHDQGTMGRSIQAWSQWWSGRPDAGLATALEAQRRAEHLPSSLTQAMALHMVGFIHQARGEAAEAMAAARANIASTEELNFPFWLGTSLLVLGSQRALLGDEGGLDDLDRAFTLLLAEGGRGGGSMGFALLALAQHALARHDQAVATAELGLAISADNGQPFYDPELRRIAALSRYALDPDRLDDSVTELSESLSQARRMGAASFALRTATDLATLPGSDGARLTRSIGELEVALAQMGDGAGTAAQVLARHRLEQLDPARASATSTKRPTR